MKSTERFTQIVYVITGLIIFELWTLIDDTNCNYIWKIVGMAIGSSLVYEIVFNVIFQLLEKSSRFKRYFFGKNYIDGYWCGFYKTIDPDGNPKTKLFYEIADQKIGTTKIQGVSFYREEGRISTQWHSYNVTFNQDLDKIVYCMESERCMRDHISHGFTVCNFYPGEKGYPAVMFGHNYTPENGVAKRIDTYAEKVELKNLKQDELKSKCEEIYQEKHNIL